MFGVVSANVLLPLLSSAVSFVFAATVLAQWSRRRRAFQLVWAVGLLWYGISAGTEFLGSAFGWTEPLYRAWYLIGAFFVAAYLGAGTVVLLARTRFGYFVAASFLGGALYAFAIRGRYPNDVTSFVVVLGACAVTAVALALATWRARQLVAPITLAALVAGSVIAAYTVLTATLAAPYALDATTGVPVGEAIPGNIRVLAGPFNIIGASALVAGAVFSAYVFMPKRRVLGRRALPAGVAQLYGTVAVVVNFVASLPRAIVALVRGELHSRVPATLLIALGGFIPAITSGLNRFGITWAFFLGELLGVLLIFAGFVVSTEVFGSRVRLGPLVVRRKEEAPAT
jgi:6,7-dimethyl-8-ribityllumazine synthase